MARSYTKEQVEKKIKNALLDENLYKGELINYKGCIKDSKESYEDYIAEYFLKNGLDKYFAEMLPINRTEKYKVDAHYSPRLQKEKYLCKGFVGCNLGKLGKIEDFEMPLKGKQSDKDIKAIDMISINDEEKTVYLVEFKHSKNDETLLRAILEVATYYAKIEKREKVVEDYGKKGYTLKKAVLVPWGCNAYNELSELRNGKRPALNKLAKLLEVELYSLDFCVK